MKRPSRLSATAGSVQKSEGVIFGAIRRLVGEASVAANEIVIGKAIGVVGGGAWGTALAHALACAGKDVTLWAYETETVEEIAAHRTNRVFLAGVDLHPALKPTADLADLSACDLVLLVPPAQHLGRIAAQLGPHLPEGVPVVVCAKGIERGTNRLLGEVLADAMPDRAHAFLSGPSFAADVSRGRPAALTVACRNETLGADIARALGSRRMRLYWSSDTTGVQLGGAVKNVLAIAAGIVDGMELGASAHAALVTRGFAELRRFGAALGAQPETLSGLSGLGDLILTCGSPQSRNMSLGKALGQGRSAAEILGGRKSVTEGVFTAAAVVAIAQAQGIEVPIARAVHDIVEHDLPIGDAIEALMARPMKEED